jgi:hypothetical protein
MCVYFKDLLKLFFSLFFEERENKRERERVEILYHDLLRIGLSWISCLNMAAQKCPLISQIRVLLSMLIRVYGEKLFFLF